MDTNTVRNGLLEHARTHGGRGFTWWASRPLARVEQVPYVGLVSVVDRDTDDDNNGYGADTHLVFSVDDGDRQAFFRQDGFTSSYDGDTWDGAFREVRAREKTVTLYE